MFVPNCRCPIEPTFIEINRSPCTCIQEAGILLEVIDYVWETLRGRRLLAMIATQLDGISDNHFTVRSSECNAFVLVF